MGLYSDDMDRLVELEAEVEQVKAELSYRNDEMADLEAEVERLQADNQRLRMNPDCTHLSIDPPCSTRAEVVALRAEVVRLQQRPIIDRLMEHNARGKLRMHVEQIIALHQPEWASEQAKAAGKEPWACVLCGTADGSWPCSTRMEADEMLAQLDGSADQSSTCDYCHGAIKPDHLWCTECGSVPPARGGPLPDAAGVQVVRDAHGTPTSVHLTIEAWDRIQRLRAELNQAMDRIAALKLRLAASLEPPGGPDD